MIATTAKMPRSRKSRFTLAQRENTSRGPPRLLTQDARRADDEDEDQDEEGVDLGPLDVAFEGERHRETLEQTDEQPAEGRPRRLPIPPRTAAVKA